MKQHLFSFNIGGGGGGNNNNNEDDEDEEPYQNDQDEEEEDEEEYDEGGEEKPSKLTTYVLDLHGHQIQLHVWNDVRYFFLRDVEKHILNWGHKKVKSHMDLIHMTPITARSLVQGNVARQLLTLNDINILLPQLTQITSTRHAEIMDILRCNQITIKPYVPRPPPQRQQRRTLPLRLPAPQQDLSSFLDEMRKIVDKAVDNISPAALYIYTQSDEFKKQVEIRVKEDSEKIIATRQFELERESVIRFTTEKMKELDSKRPRPEQEQQIEGVPKKNKETIL